jgi:hypothetical protein
VRRHHNHVAGKAYREIDETDDEVVYNELGATVMPNPSTNYFSVVIKSGNDAPIRLRVQDALGRLKEVKTNLSANGSLQLGSTYPRGVYLLQLVQGNNVATARLIKE